MKKDFCDTCKKEIKTGVYKTEILINDIRFSYYELCHDCLTNKFKECIMKFNRIELI